MSFSTGGRTRGTDHRFGRATRWACLALASLLMGVQETDSKKGTTRAESTGSGRIAGKVLTKPERTLSDTIVYLECLDAEKTFPVPEKPAVVSQKGAKFAPSLVVVSVGQKIEFPNDEDRPVQHNVFSKSPSKPFDLGLYKPGVSKTVVFDKPGVVNLHCSIHRQMDGVIFVSPTPFFARVAADGSFAIEQVPAGNYELRTWQRRRRYREGVARVEVRADQTATVDVELSRK